MLSILEYGAHLLKCRVPRNLPALFLLLVLLLTWQVTAAQQPPSQPQVKVNMINVCSPSAEERKEIADALGRVPRQPLLGADFEVDRGRSTMDERPGFLQTVTNSKSSAESATADWVRIRHEFGVQAMFSSVQYSFSQDAENMTEILVFRVRDPKDLMELSLEDSASAVTTPAAMLDTNTPVNHIKLERFGKTSVVLARCQATEQNPAPDQSTYEPLFQSATAIVSNYRRLLGARYLVPEELARISGAEIKGAKPMASRSHKAAKTQP